MKDGSFTLSEVSLNSSRMTDGVLPGKYRVCVTASRVIDENSGEVEWLVPSQYADFRSSGIEHEIFESRDDLVVNLTWKGSEYRDEDQNFSDVKTHGSPEVKESKVR